MIQHRKLPYEKKRPKHERTPSYFHLVRKLANCMMISDQLNWHDHGSYVEKTAPSSNINVTDEEKSKEIILHKTLPENSSTDVSKSERKICQQNLITEQFRGRTRKYYYGIKRQGA